MAITSNDDEDVALRFITTLRRRRLDVDLAHRMTAMREKLTPTIAATEADDKVITGAYKPFGTPSTPGEVIKGNVKCGGSIVRFDADGSIFELVASGLRNPFGLEFDGNKQLWATFHGVDVRGNRNPFNDPDYLVRVEQGAWYGWPDFYDGEPVTAARFNAPEKAKPTFLWKEHPPLAKAFATFTTHAAVSGLTFSPGGEFGFGGDAFLAEYASVVVRGMDRVRARRWSRPEWSGDAQPAVPRCA